MELKYYLSIMRRWFWLILLCTVLAGSVSYFFSGQKLQTFAANSTILLDTSHSTSATPAYSDLMVNERLAETYAALLTQREAIEAVKAQMNRQPDLVSVSVQPQRNTSIMKIVVTSDDAEAAAYVANHLPDLINEQQRERQAGRYAATKASLSEELAISEQEVTATRLLLVSLDANDPNDQVEMSSLSAKLTLQERTYETLRQHLFSIRMAEDQGTNILSVIESAKMPTIPIGPNILNDTLFAAILGTLVGLGAAFLIEYLDDTIKATSDVGGMLKLGVLALIGRIERGGRRVLVTSLDHRAPVTEAYRMLRTNIRFSMVDAPLQTLLITSPGPNEGKSTTAANLAVVMAQAGHRTILIDADLRRPVQHSIFNVSNKEGLTTALVERDQPIEKYLNETGTKGLYVLTSGPMPPNPSELLGSQRMREVMAQLQAHADYIVIDTSPVLAVTDSSLLASFVSGVLLVLRANSTRLDAAQRAIEQLVSVQANLLGTVLNGVHSKRDGYYYYYSNPKHSSRAVTLGAKLRTLFMSILPRRS